jgi:hypothetical protein
VSENEQINNLRIKIAQLETQLNRVVSDAESEKANRRRTNKFILEEISRVKKLYTDWAIKIDRLEQDNDRRKNEKKQLIAQGVVLSGVIVKLITDWMSRK